MADVLLGAIDLQYSGGGVVAADGPTNLPFDASVEQSGLYVDQPKGGEFVIPGGGGMVTLPTDTAVTFLPGGPSGGGGAAPDLQEDKPAIAPTEKSAGMNKKNMLLFGIGGLILAYLLLRKK